MIIAVDFDGTIVDHRFPDIGTAVPGAIYWLKRFKEVGFKLVLWTMRSDGQSNGNVLTQALEYCSRMGVEFDGVNHSPGQDSWTSSPKAYAQIYIDDAGFGCPLKENPRCGGRPYVDWDVIGPAVLGCLGSGFATPSLESELCLRPVRVVKPVRIAVKQLRVHRAPARAKAKNSSRVSKPKSKRRPKSTS
jgi:hypothetical protein